MMRGIWRLVAIALAACAPVAVSTPTSTSTSTPTPTPTATATTTATATSTTTGPVTLIAVGDVMLARTLATRLSPSPFTAVASILQSADVAVANLECAVGVGGTPAKKAFTFLAPPAAAATLADAGLDVVTLANNHSLDFGPDVLAQTFAALDSAHVAHAGAGATEDDAHRPAIVEVRGKRLAFLGYVDVMTEGTGFDVRSWEAHGASPGVAWLDTARIGRDVAAAKANADIVVVMLHTGFEGHWVANVWQRAAAHAAIDAGALVVLGAHPHLLQGVERYKGGFVAYSLGDFVFDGKDKYSAMLHLTFDGDAVKDVSWTPVLIHDGIPTLVDAKASAAIERLIESLSRQLPSR
jgi:poly-gamma-glutamate synthesis protein (capsule biosynthesis protein)